MNFNQLINLYEKDTTDTYLKRRGKIPVICTAVHTMTQYKDDGTIKLREPYTKAIAMYTANKTEAFYYVKQKDTGIDSNSLIEDEFKKELLSIIKENNIKLLIDIHGAKEDREFDVEFGTLNNLSADFSTINELKESFIENGITKVVINNPFKGGGITQYIYENTNIDIIQIEINKKYRNKENIDNIEKVCNSLISFIKMYTNFN